MSRNIWEKTANTIDRRFVPLAIVSTAALTTAFCMNVGYEWDATPAGADTIHAEMQETLNDIISEKDDLNLVAQRITLDEQEMDLAIKRAELEGESQEAIEQIAESRIQAIQAMYDSASDRADALEDASEDFARDMLVSYEQLGERNMDELRNQFNDADLDAGRYAVGPEPGDLDFMSRALNHCPAEIGDDPQLKFNITAKAEAVVNCAYNNGTAEATKYISFIPAGIVSVIGLMLLGGMAESRGHKVRRRQQSKKQKVGNN